IANTSCTVASTISSNLSSFPFRFLYVFQYVLHYEVQCFFCCLEAACFHLDSILGGADRVDLYLATSRPAYLLGADESLTNGLQPAWLVTAHRDCSSHLRPLEPNLALSNLGYCLIPFLAELRCDSRLRTHSNLT